MKRRTLNSRRSSDKPTTELRRPFDLIVSAVVTITPDMTPAEKATNAATAMSRAMMASCVGRRASFRQTGTDRHAVIGASTTLSPVLDRLKPRMRRQLVTVGVPTYGRRPTLPIVPPASDDPDDQDADHETHGEKDENNDSNKDYLGHLASRSLADGRPCRRRLPLPTYRG
ncbi:MAG: hypothetical protein ACXVBY_12515 [Isosphaeraceae bacterium]